MGILRIIGGVILVIVVAFGLIIGWNVFVGTRQAHSQYCEDWNQRINESKANTNMFTGDAQIAQLNTEINQYNHECLRGS
jgi:uncharacterized protein YneF (UPF0154 family)